MIVIYPDANALWRNISLSNEVGERLRKRLRAGSVELRIWPVVLAELRRQANEELRLARSEAVSATERATRATNTDTAKLVADQQSLFNQITAGIDDQFSELLALDGVSVDDWPSLSARDVGERELDGKRPFLDKPAGTIGHRDALIWAGVIEGLETISGDEGDIAIFVSKDEGFRAEKGKRLHADLQSDVDDTFDGRFELVPSLFDALTVIDLYEEAITRREANIRNALSAFARELDNVDWDWENTELPPDLESPRVLSAEYLGGEVIGEGNPATCTFMALVQIEGAMLKDQWYVDMDSEVQLWDGEVNDYYFSVYVERTVEFEVEVDLDDEGTVTYVEANDVRIA